MRPRGSPRLSHSRAVTVASSPSAILSYHSFAPYKSSSCTHQIEIFFSRRAGSSWSVVVGALHPYSDTCWGHAPDQGTAARLRTFLFLVASVSIAGVVGTGGGDPPRREARRHPTSVLRRHPRAGGSPGQRRGVPLRWGASSSTPPPSFFSPPVEVRLPAKPAPHLPTPPRLHPRRTRQPRPHTRRSLARAAHPRHLFGHPSARARQLHPLQVR